MSVKQRQQRAAAEADLEKQKAEIPQTFKRNRVAKALGEVSAEELFRPITKRLPPIEEECPAPPPPIEEEDEVPGEMVAKEVPGHLQTTDSSEQIIHYNSRGSLSGTIKRALNKMAEDPNYTVKDKDPPIRGLNKQQLEKIVEYFKLPPAPQLEKAVARPPATPEQLQEGLRRLKKTPPPPPKKEEKYLLAGQLSKQ